MPDTTALRHNIQIRTNETFVLPVVHKPGGVVSDLTGYTARMQVRDSAAGAVLLDSASSPNSATIDPPNGGVTITYAVGQVGTVVAKTGVYDLALTAPDGTVDVILSGQAQFVPGVTR